MTNKGEESQKLSEEEFLKTFENAPRTAVSLLIQNSERKILLTKRSIPPFPNQWHLPGSFIRKRESIKRCVERIASEELGLEQIQLETELLGVFDDLDKDPRGHVIDIIFGLTLKDRLPLKPRKGTKEVKFFEKLPHNIGFNHRETLNKLGYEDER